MVDGYTQTHLQIQQQLGFYNPTQAKADIEVIDSRGRVVREYNDGVIADKYND